MDKKLSSNMEMYLKTIFRLERDSTPVRVKAIADTLGVTMPSVSEAMRVLKARGFVEHSSYGEVRLSDDGRRVAANVDQRFESLRRFLADMLQLEMDVAEREACEIEHVVGDDTLLRLSAFIDWMSHHRDDVSECLRNFHEYLNKLAAGDTAGADRLLHQSSSDSAGEA